MGMSREERWGKQFDYLIQDGCRPIDVSIVKKLCMGFMESGGKKANKFALFYCQGCKIVHEERFCPRCGSDNVISAKETEAIVLKDVDESQHKQMENVK